MTGLEEQFTFLNCMTGLAPNIRSKYLGNGVEVLNWENVWDYQKYEDAFPAELKAVTDRITTGKNDRILFVCDSENMIRKAILYYALQKHRAMHAEGVRNNRPLRGEQAEEIPEIMAGKIDLRTEKEKLSRQWKTLENLTEWHCVYGYHFDTEDFEEENEDFLWEALFAERDCNVLLGISNAQYSSERAAKLICEGGFKPVFLPTETEGYFENFAARLFIQPAANQHIFDYPEETEIEYDDLCADYPYLNALKIEDIKAVLSILKKRRGKAFCERDIAVLFQQAGEAEISLMQFLHGQPGKTYQDLQKMTGFVQVKELIKRRRALFFGKKENPKLKIIGQHYLFVGNPGTGKTEGAKLMHEVLAGEGYLTGNLVIASREDIIGSYTGQTAPKVAGLFERAAGGTLFVDEAGFFLHKNSGGFVQEALKEFVRYMETRRDVTVIFAVYPGEKTEFLNLDPGLSSRVGQVVHFPDHDEDTLCEIGAGMWEEQGYEPEEEVWTVLRDFLRTQKEKGRRNFGNAREVRRLVELSIQEAEIRRMEVEELTDADKITVYVKDLKKAILLLAEANEDGNDSMVGFCLKNKDRREQVIAFAPACREC